MNYVKCIMLCVVFGALAPLAQAFTGAGTGTVGDPYQITDCDGLREMADDLDAHYRLENHIECGVTASWNGGKGFAPVGTSTAPFTGSLDGQNFEIRDLFIERADDLSGEGVEDEQYVGLFGYTEDATLENIRLTNAAIKGYRYVGGLVGYAVRGNLENIQVNVGVTYLEIDVLFDPDVCVPAACIWARWGEYGGGVAGYTNGTTISNVVVGGAVKGSGIIIGGVVGSALDTTITYATSTAFIDGGEDIGGIVGQMQQGSMTRVISTGQIDGTNDNGKRGDRIGGIAGIVEDNATVSYATSTSNVTGNRRVAGLIGRLTESSVSYAAASGVIEGLNEVGGLIGSADDASVATSSATGDVSGIEFSIGGFAGRFSSGYLLNSFATGDVTGGESVGGVFGSSGCGAEIVRVYATGDVTATGASAGGFSGNDGCEGPGSTMSQVFATGDVTGVDQVGGFLGSSGGLTITDAYAAGTVTGTNFVGGFSGQVSNSQLINVYARGLVTGDTLVGGLIGESNENTITALFWDSVASNQSTSAAGTGIATPGMKMRSTYTDAGWDFSTIWGINATDNNGYPFFRWQGFAPLEETVEEDTPRRGGGGGGTRRTTATIPVTTESGSNESVSNDSQNVAISVALRNFINQNRALFEAARKAGITLPTVITDVLDQAAQPTVDVTGLTVRDLYRGLSGEDVRALQVLLINNNAGPKARALARVTATGDFINYTEEALIEYQLKYGITPAAGYFGPATRSQMKAAGLPGLWW